MSEMTSTASAEASELNADLSATASTLKVVFVTGSLHAPCSGNGTMNDVSRGAAHKHTTATSCLHCARTHIGNVRVEHFDICEHFDDDEKRNYFRDVGERCDLQTRGQESK